MNVPLLLKFMSNAGFIKNRHDNGLCKKMQSRVERTIKHARALGLFSYKDGFAVRNPASTPKRFDLPDEEEKSYRNEMMKKGRKLRNIPNRINAVPELEEEEDTVETSEEKITPKEDYLSFIKSL